MMRTSLQGILSRVERLQADMQTRHGDKDLEELVRILDEGRLRAARGEFRPWNELTKAEQAEKLAQVRALRQALREAGRSV